MPRTHAPLTGYTEKRNTVNWVRFDDRNCQTFVNVWLPTIFGVPSQLFSLDLFPYLLSIYLTRYRPTLMSLQKQSWSGESSSLFYFGNRTNCLYRALLCLILKHKRRQSTTLCIPPIRVSNYLNSIWIIRVLTSTIAFGLDNPFCNRNQQDTRGVIVPYEPSIKITSISRSTNWLYLNLPLRTFRSYMKF